MDLVKKKRTYTPRQPKPDPNAALVAELVAIVRETGKQQSDVLAAAMEAQRSQAEMLKTWMSMFVPQGGPNKSTSEMDREAIRNNADLGEWEPMEAPLFSDFPHL